MLTLMDNHLCPLLVNWSAIGGYFIGEARKGPVSGIAQESHFLATTEKKTKKNEDILWLAPTAYGLGTSKKL